MKQKCGKLCNNNFTIEELEPNLSVQKTTFKDAPQIIDVLLKCGFGIPNKQEALRQLLYSRADLNNSIKVIDNRTNEIYGILIFSLYTLKEGTPLTLQYPIMISTLDNFTQVNGYAFALDERLRGRGYDKKMLALSNDFIKKFDFIWCAVENELMSHNYWKNLGFTEIGSIPEAKFYLRLLNKKKFADIYN